VATNAILEGKGATVGLVTTEGFRQVLQIARSFVPGGLAGWIIWPKPEPLAALENTVEVPGRIASDGSVVRELDEDAARAQLRRLRDAVVARLAPQVLCLTDGGPGRRAARRPVTGSDRVARFLASVARRYGRHLAARPAVVGGAAGAILSADGATEQVMAVTSRDGVITAIYFVGNPDKLTSAERLPLLE
jgi:Hydantoinase/oxoprolinase N-terminal region